MVISPHFTSCASVDDIARLETDLFSNYSLIPRPVYNQSEVVRVGLEIYLFTIIKLDAVSSVIELSAGAIISWYDYRLTWDPNNYGGLTTLVVDSSSLWFPGLFIISTADELEILGADQFHVDISSTGNISWVVGKLLTSSCSMDMTSFPVDTQTCSVVIMPWGYTETEVVVYPLVNTINMGFSNPNGEWNVDKTLVAEYDAYKPNASALSAELTLSRKSAYFVISLVLPMNLIGLLTPVVFLLPASSGERISYSITMFLSLTVYMTIVSDSIPKVSEPMAGITYFTLVGLIYSSTVVLLTIVTIRFEALDDVDNFPKWIISTVKWLVTFCQKRRVAQVEDKADGKHDRDVDTTSTDLTKMMVIKYIDYCLFAITMTVTIITITCFTGVYYV
ncbi:neuronal acetylcholine receptor subunit alpha-3-like [Mizuhopecten yessoensis]|nr:neuronal acetylcholine receptor subunit alpha-3-like [Mizuhopecten yessoensis]